MCNVLSWWRSKYPAAARKHHLVMGIGIKYLLSLKETGRGVKDIVGICSAKKWSEMWFHSLLLFFFSTLPWSPQTPFTFGLNQRAPYTAGDRCLLCRCERKDGAVPSEAGMPGQNGTSQPNKSALQLPLWVCSDCRRTVEKEDRHTALEQSLGVSHLLIKEIGFAVLNCHWLCSSLPQINY